MLFQFIVLQVVIFGAVIYFLKKIFYGDTESAIQRLGHVYQDLLQKQTDLQQKNEAMEKELIAKREEAHSVAEKFKVEASAEARKKEDAIMKTARAEAEEIIAKAQNSREDMAKEIESQLSKKMIGFTTEVITKALTEKLSQVIHAQLVADFIEKAKNIDLSSAGSEVSEFVVRSPMPLKKEEADKINALLASKLSRSVKFSEVLDTDLVAGLVLQFGTLVLEGSLLSLLRDSVERVRERY